MCRSLFGEPALRRPYGQLEEERARRIARTETLRARNHAERERLLGLGATHVIYDDPNSYVSMEEARRYAEREIGTYTFRTTYLTADGKEIDG